MGETLPDLLGRIWSSHKLSSVIKLSTADITVALLLGTTGFG
jgi:hypothetical protein